MEILWKIKPVLLGLLLFFAEAPGRASVVNLGWDANMEEDLAGYRLYRGTGSLLATSTSTAASDASIQKTTLDVSTETVVAIPAATRFYFRLTAFDTNDNESGFNVDASSQDAEVSVLMKNGDVDGDDQVTLVDLSLLLSAYQTAKASCDFNNDGVVNLTDLSLLLGNWGK